MPSKAPSKELFDINELTSLCYQADPTIASLLHDKRQKYNSSPTPTPKLIVTKPAENIKPKETYVRAKEDAKPIFIFGVFSVLGGLMNVTPKYIDHFPNPFEVSKEVRANTPRLII